MTPYRVVAVASQTALPSVRRDVGRKPSLNQPHVTCRSFSRSPMFRPVIAAVTGACGQSSNAGSTLAIMLPSTTSPVGLLVCTPWV